MKVAIVGFATEGKLNFEYYKNRGDEVTICDQDIALNVPIGAGSQIGKHYLDNLDRFDIVVRSAGVRPSDILKENPGIEHKITTQVNEFIIESPTKNIIGITGTKGKGTTSTLTANILEAAGKRVFLGGNVGTPPYSFIDQLEPDDWVVLELSSFQLTDFVHSPHIAACLMVVPEHLDWHETLNDYVASKSRLFSNQVADDIAIYYAKNPTSKKIAHTSKGHLIPFSTRPGAHLKRDTIVIDGEVVCRTSEIKLLGKHNWQNVCAAITIAWQVTQDIPAIKKAITSFSGLEHRLEFVRELKGVKYYNDSFGTTPETAIVALEAFQEPKVLILGGASKNIKYHHLIKQIPRNNVRSVILIGHVAQEIRNLLNEVGFHNYVIGGDNMEEIVRSARRESRSGDVVLLSPGFASFGLFKDYKDRGNQFKQVVESLV